MNIDETNRSPEEIDKILNEMEWEDDELFHLQEQHRSMQMVSWVFFWALIACLIIIVWAVAV